MLKFFKKLNKRLLINIFCLLIFSCLFILNCICFKSDDAYFVQFSVITLIANVLIFPLAICINILYIFLLCYLKKIFFSWLIVPALIVVILISISCRKKQNKFNVYYCYYKICISFLYSLIIFLSYDYLLSNFNIILSVTIFIFDLKQCLLFFLTALIFLPIPISCCYKFHIIKEKRKEIENIKKGY